MENILLVSHIKKGETLKNYLIAFVFAVLFIQGCATPYQKQGLTGGFSESQLDTNVFKVSFEGNGYTNEERASDFTLLRSAELSLQNNFKYFSIIDDKSRMTNTSQYTAGRVNYSGSYASYGGTSYNVSRPSTSNTIVCYTKKPNNIFTYNASFIRKSLRQKYNMKNTTT